MGCSQRAFWRLAEPHASIKDQFSIRPRQHDA